MLQLLDQIHSNPPGVVAGNIIALVQDGHMDPLQVMAVLDAAKRVHDEVRKGIEDNVITALQQRVHNTAVVDGAKLTIAETGTKYDYSVSPQWQRLNTEAEEAVAKRKAHEDMLKTIKSHTVLVDPVTGAVAELSSVPKSSRTSFKIETAK